MKLNNFYYSTAPGVCIIARGVVALPKINSLLLDIAELNYWQTYINHNTSKS